MDAKELGNEAAHPNTFSHPDNSGFMTTKGLTKRELFAAMCLQGMCASHTREDGNFRHLMLGMAECAVDAADALLAELAKES